MSDQRGPISSGAGDALIAHLVAQGYERAEPADPDQFGRFESDALVAQLFIQRHCRRSESKHSAILGRCIVDRIDRKEGPGARHVAGDHIWIAWDMATQVLGDQAGICVVAATGWVADDEFNVFSLEEIGRRLRMGDPSQKSWRCGCQKNALEHVH